jgi:hypothetical protein
MSAYDPKRTWRSGRLGIRALQLLNLVGKGWLFLVRERI